jgi:hypothetical protein
MRMNAGISQNPEYVIDLRERFFEAISPQVAPKRRIYIPRKNNKIRHTINEDDLIEVLKNYPFFSALTSALEIHYDYFPCQGTPAWSEHVLDLSAFENFLVQFLDQHAI